MESYIKNTLGLPVEFKSWKDINTLPDELKREREYSLMELLGIRCLVIKMNASDFQLSTFQKDSKRLIEYCDYPQVLCFERINSYQRKCLIENNQAFVVPDNQLYLPFVGVMLQERFKAAQVSGTVLTAMAQYILLFLVLNANQEYYSKLEISQKLDINLMNVTRGVQELEELSLATEKKKGRSSMVTLMDSPKETIKTAKDYLRSPILRTEYVKPLEWMKKLPTTGEAFIIEKKNYLEVADQLDKIDPDWSNEKFVELQVWRYDSTRLTDSMKVDPISQALALMGDDTTAVEMIIDKL